LWVPAALLVAFCLTSGQVGAVEWFGLDQPGSSDADDQIMTVAHYHNGHFGPRSYRVDDCYPCPPGMSTPEGMADGMADGMAPERQAPDPRMTQEPLAETFDSFRGGQLASRGSATLPGYIDDAFIRSRVRVRYDDMQGANEPTRAEFMYPTLGVFGGPGPLGPAAGAAGGGSAAEVDFQELATYVEVAFLPRFSVFGEFPVRWVEDVNFGDPPGNLPGPVFLDGEQDGAGDIRGGVRFGLISCPYEALTVQVRAWAPTGEARRALGVGHPSIDVALLYGLQVNHRTTFFAEVQDWQSIDAGEAVDPNFPDNSVDLDANVLRYGVGLGYDLWQSCDCRPKSLTALFEVVGWSVLEGVTTPASFDPSVMPPDPAEFEDASGDTIINGKYGLRYNWTCWGCQRQSIYMGYGHNWTDERWYSDVFRLELTHFF
jgi:hypothetical protein